MPEQASSGHSFQLGILPERKIDRRALAASYGFVVLLALLLINLGMLFPDRLQLKQYRVTSLIPMPALRPEHVPVNRKPLKVKLLPPAPVFQQPKLVVPHEVRHITAPEPVEAPKVVMNTFTAPQLKMTSGGARPQLVAYGRFLAEVRSDAHGERRGAKSPDRRLWRSQRFERHRQTRRQALCRAGRRL